MLRIAERIPYLKNLIERKNVGFRVGLKFG